MEYTQKLPVDFYQRSSVTDIAKDLLGQYLCTQLEGELTVGRIVETEAYCGESDQACHAFLNRRTTRTEVMFAPGGIAYIYLCYGIHALFNIVTNREDYGDAVLIRAIEPIEGADTMLLRRNMDKVKKPLLAGPGRLTQALGITTQHDTISLQSDHIWIAEGASVPKSRIVATPRIGIDYAGEDVLLPWRYLEEGSKWVSGTKKQNKGV